MKHAYELGLALALAALASTLALGVPAGLAPPADQSLATIVQVTADAPRPAAK